MKLYVQVLAIVLCSCLIQDVLSNVQSSNKRQAASGQVEPKYIYLDKVNKMFWSTWEEINTNEFGKMGTRTVRNTMHNILTNNKFWIMLVKLVKQRSDITHDKIQADAQVKFCNTLTKALIDPAITSRITPLAENVYDAVVQIKSNDLKRGLQLAIDIVTGQKILEFIKIVHSLVSHIDFNPKLLTRYFSKFKSTLNLSNKFNFGDDFWTNAMLRISSKANSARSNPERSASAHFE